MQYEFDWSGVLDPMLWLRALAVTISYGVGSVVAGLALGVVGGTMLLSRNVLLRGLAALFVQFFRCTPLMVQLVWFYYALPILSGFSVPAALAAGLGLTLYMGAFSSEIVRAGVISIGRGQWDAARALGLKHWPMMRFVILPQAARRMVPPFVNQSVLQLKNTSLLYVVAVPDLMYTSYTLTSRTYRPLETYTAVALIYFAVLFPATLAAKRLEARYDR
jgi:polar amino acid transport system permease protein